MNKNHFFIAYSGNKRQEFNNIYENIKDQLENIEYIVEPFCGSSAFSYFLSLKHPGKFKYILNDNNKYLIESYKIFKDTEKTEQLINKLNSFLINLDKEKYKNLVKVDNVDNWFFKHKFYAIRAGLYPINHNKKDFNDLYKTPIINFLKNEEIILSNEEGSDICKKYENNNKALIFLDPPYMQSENSFYSDGNVNIYEYLNNNNILKNTSKIILVLEDNWIVKLLFKEHKFISYPKKYEYKQRKTNHLIINNF